MAGPTSLAQVDQWATQPSIKPRKPHIPNGILPDRKSSVIGIEGEKLITSCKLAGFLHILIRLETFEASKTSKVCRDRIECPSIAFSI
jgi:hypothetical protein